MIKLPRRVFQRRGNVLGFKIRIVGEDLIARNPCPETRDYVARVLALYGRIAHAFDESLTAASPLLR